MPGELTSQISQIFNLEENGTPIGANDMLIAAHAQALGYTIVTDNEENPREFATLRVRIGCANQIGRLGCGGSQWNRIAHPRRPPAPRDSGRCHTPVNLAQPRFRISSLGQRALADWIMSPPLIPVNRGSSVSAIGSKLGLNINSPRTAGETCMSATERNPKLPANWLDAAIP